MENNTFKTLSQINVNGMVEKKQTGGTTSTYLSWASAFQAAKENYPGLEYEVERNPETGMPYWYDPLTGYMVFTKVTIGGQTHEMWLPVMDGTNHAMKAEPYQVQTKYKKFTVPAATMCDINKAIMRCLVKNLSMFGLGLGLYIYRGEDFPEGESQSLNKAQPTQAQPVNKPIEKVAPVAPVQQKATAQKPARDTRPVTVDQIKAIRQTLNKWGMDEQFICGKYRVQKLGDLQMYQYHHIVANINKLKQIYDSEKQQRLIDIVKDSKQKQAETRTVLTFGDAIAPPQPQQKKTEGEEVSLESLGLSPADLDALTECGNVFN